MAGDFVTGTPWSYTPPPYPLHHPDFLHHFQPPDYSHPPSPPYVYHPYEIPTYDTGGFTYTQFQPATYTPPVVDVSPETTTLISDVIRNQLLDKVFALTQSIEKRGETLAATSRTFTELANQSSRMSQLIKDMKCDLVAFREVESGNAVIIASELCVNDDGGDVFRRTGGSETWKVLKERDKDEGSDLFSEAEKIIDVESEDLTQLQVLQSAKSDAPHVFDKYFERVFVQKVPRSIFQGTNHVIFSLKPLWKSLKRHYDDVMIYKLHENEYGKVLVKSQKSIINMNKFVHKGVLLNVGMKCCCSNGRLCKCLCSVSMCDLIDDIPKRDSVVWNVKHGLGSHHEQIVKRWVGEEFKEESCALLSSCCAGAHNVVVASLVVGVYATCGLFGYAMKVLSGVCSNVLVLEISKRMFPLLSTSVGAHLCRCTSVSVHFGPDNFMIGQSGEGISIQKEGAWVLEEITWESCLGIIQNLIILILEDNDGLEEKQTKTMQWKQEGSVDFVQYQQQTTGSDVSTLDEFKQFESRVVPKVLVTKNMVMAWHWSITTLVFDPGVLWLLHSISNLIHPCGQGYF